MTFETVRENAISAEDKLQSLVQAKRNREKNMSNLRNKVVLESQQLQTLKEMEELDEACEAKQKKLDELDKMKEACKAKKRKEGKITLESTLYEQGKQEIMQMVLFEMVYNAFVADEDFKESKTLEMFESYKEQVQLIESICTKKPNNKFMQEVESIVEAVCKKAAKRIAKETDEIDRIDFKLNDDEVDELDENLDELNKDQLEQMVKDKVVQVIKDEKEQNIKKAELIEEIDDELAEIQPEDGETTSLEESFRIKVLTKKKASIRNNFGDSLFNGIMMETTKTLEESVVKEGLSIEDKTNIMDTVLVESILKYTVMETMHTLGLYEFDKYAIDKLCKTMTFTR